MDGENNGKPYEQMDEIWWVFPYFWFNTHISFHLLLGEEKRPFNDLKLWDFLIPTKYHQWRSPRLGSMIQWMIFMGIIDNYMGVSKNRGVSPQIIHFNRVFHYFHHPFWGFSFYFWKHPYVFVTGENVNSPAVTKWGIF